MIKPRIVIKLSGSLFNFDTNSVQLNDYIQLIKKISNVYQPVIITGGGKIARFYINLSRSLGMDESGLDLIGIQVSHLNARLLISGLRENCYPLPPRNLEEISVALLSGLVIITGGIYPGQSTNATSALIAERIGATKFQDCVSILKSEKSMAGTYDLMDLISLKVIERSNLPTVVFKSTVDNIEKLVLDNVKMGTEITI